LTISSAYQTQWERYNNCVKVHALNGWFLLYAWITNLKMDGSRTLAYLQAASGIVYGLMALWNDSIHGKKIWYFKDFLKHKFKTLAFFVKSCIFVIPIKTFSCERKLLSRISRSFKKQEVSGYVIHGKIFFLLYFHIKNVIFILFNATK